MRCLSSPCTGKHEPTVVYDHLHTHMGPNQLAAQLYQEYLHRLDTKMVVQPYLHCVFRC